MHFCFGVDKRPNDSYRIGFKGLTYGQEFNDVETSLAALIFGHIGLRFTQLLGHVGLVEAGLPAGAPRHTDSLRRPDATMVRRSPHKDAGLDS